MISHQERRAPAERRRRRIWSVWYGSFNPRRRARPRRADEAHFHAIDWYSPHLLAVAIGIALLCAVDALLTLQLLADGADEINPMMAALLHRGVAIFVGAKVTLTGTCIVTLVVMSRYRFMRILPVEGMLYAVLAAYLTLIGYEIGLLKGHTDVLNLQFY